MRIHQITSSYSMFMGGAEQVVRALHLGLRERQVEAYLLGIMHQQDHRLEGARCLMLKSPYQFRAFTGIYRYLAEQVRPGDVVHGHEFPTIFYISLIELLRRDPLHLICTEHSTSNRRRNTLLGRLLDAITYARYDRVVAISQGVEQELLKWKPGLKGKTCVIQNGVRLHFDRCMERPPKQRLRIVSVGNLRPMKNYENALRAAALLEPFDFEYVIAGVGERREALLQLRADLRLDSKVSLIGYETDIQALLASADVFLMPSLWEGFGLAAVEAMNAGLPLVLSNVDGLRELVAGAPPCAVLVDPRSPHSIAEGLQKLLHSPELRLQLGRNAFEQAQNFSVDQMVKNYLSVYNQFN